MIHYINGKPHKNVQMNKPKRRAVENYRHTQRLDALTGVGIIAAITVVCTLVALAVTA